MTTPFIPIRGGKFVFIENENIRNQIDEAGRKFIVFVEGYDDRVIYRILYEDKSDRIEFIDVSLYGQSTGGAEKVKEYVEKMVYHLKNEEYYFGITDRDFRTDQELEDEKNNPKYNNKLYIFSERYTLENYFIDSNLLLKFLEGKSMSNKGLINILDINKIKQITSDICMDLIIISAANWTLKFFREEFMGRTAPCEEGKVKNILINKIVNRYGADAEDYTKDRYEYYKNYISNRISELQKYIHGKYFFFQFNEAIKKETQKISGRRITIDIDNAKDNLARILRIIGLSDDFKMFERLIGI